MAGDRGQGIASRKIGSWKNRIKHFSSSLTLNFLTFSQYQSVLPKAIFLPTCTVTTGPFACVESFYLRPETTTDWGKIRATRRPMDREVYKLCTNYFSARQHLVSQDRPRTYSSSSSSFRNSRKVCHALGIRMAYCDPGESPLHQKLESLTAADVGLGKKSRLMRSF